MRASSSELIPSEAVTAVGHVAVHILSDSDLQHRGREHGVELVQAPRPARSATMRSLQVTPHDVPPTGTRPSAPRMARTSWQSGPAETPATAARYTAEDLERVAREAAEHGVRAALARVAPLPSASPTPPEPEPYVDTGEAARRMKKTPKTIREYLRLAPKGPSAFAWKYGRDWRIHYESLATWVRNGGPRLAAARIGGMQGSTVR